MKNFRSVLLLCAVFLAGACALITPRPLNKGWQWDGVLKVMPNSFFEPVARAVEISAEAVSPVALPGPSLREELSLVGTWRYRPDGEGKGETEKWFAADFDDSSWKTMPVPNNFSIDDPELINFYQPVWFRKTFEPPEDFAGRNVRLVFEGVDYFAKVWVNGELLGEHEGYFNPFSFEVTQKLRPGRNLVVVKVTNPWDYSMEQAEHFWVHMAEKIWVKGIFTFHDSRMGGIDNSAYDAQSYGTGGIYRPVKLIATGELAIDWVLASPKLTDNYRKAEVSFEVFLTNFTDKPQEAMVLVEASGENFAGYSDLVSAKAVLAPGPNKVKLSLKIDNPRLWWPHSHPELGAPSLYRMNATVVLDKEATDRHSQVFGIKEVKLSEKGPEAFFFYINGKRLSFRGTNGIPTQYYSKITPEYLDDYFRVLKENNMDILIIHDHQAPPEVYEKADREGVVLLQNFTLIWGISACDFERPNGDPALTSNEEVIGRMAAEAMWYLYNHPSIFWWSMHDESNHIAFNGRGLLPGNFCKRTPYKQGDAMPVFVDMSMNLNLDEQLLKIAQAINQTVPIHRTGGLETDSVTWYGWYKKTYWDLYNDPEQFPLEFGGEAVSYSMASAMNYFDQWFPITSERGVVEWEYHSLELPSQLTYTGRTEKYDNFNDWSFASQLYQAVVIKYHIEINRENKYQPTGSVLQYMYNDWYPSTNFGFTDWNLEPKLALAWMKDLFSKQLAATRVDHNIHSQGEKIEIPIHLMNDSHEEFKGARVSWRIMEETDSFFIRGRAKPALENRNVPRAFVTATIGRQIPVAEAAKGQFVLDLRADSHAIAGTIKFDAPRTREPKHYTLYLDLISADGKVLSQNWDHFVVVKNRRTFRPAEGISPRPRFSLALNLARDGKPLSGAEVSVADKYNPQNKYETRLSDSGEGAVKDMLPGAYRLSAGGVSYEFLLNKNETVTVDFTPGLKTTLGTRPIIDWKPMPEQAKIWAKKY